MERRGGCGSPTRLTTYLRTHTVVVGLQLRTAEPDGACGRRIHDALDDAGTGEPPQLCRDQPRQLGQRRAQLRLSLLQRLHPWGEGQLRLLGEAGGPHKAGDAPPTAGGCPTCGDCGIAQRYRRTTPPHPAALSLYLITMHDIRRCWGLT